jgi:hypothetical protein
MRLRLQGRRALVDPEEHQEERPLQDGPQWLLAWDAAASWERPSV